MDSSTPASGRCTYCGETVPPNEMAAHLSRCSARQSALATYQPATSIEGTYFHLYVEDVWTGTYWMHLEMDGSVPLVRLDSYLRATWLECCGHRSAFTAAKDDEPAIRMQRPAHDVFQDFGAIHHQYDFDRTSKTAIRVVGHRKGHPVGPYPIMLMARNHAPEIPCTTCDQPAEWLCLKCLEGDAPDTFCTQHADAHRHQTQDVLLPIVNSPRVGMCTYSGPATPPH